MANQLPGTETEHVSCRVCHRDIPYAEALNIEAQEYIYYFCGYGCYDHWRQDEEEQEHQRKEDSRGADNP